MIINFKSALLQRMWEEADMTLLPNTYVHEVAEILMLLDAVEIINDLVLLGGFVVNEYKPDNWAVTVTVNDVEPIGSITCYFTKGSAYDVDLNEYS
ncbi:hypothetical protein QX776_03285 [Alteromonadaceae bacterium BrNp21-10]|nr:hypothetical protein [Alteromonadaceae bacterium BrNp21-10]